MSRRGGSSGRWIRRQEKDPFVERAAREGWRGRAVFKLQEIQRRERILRPGAVCVDLGSSPGSWSQFAARIVGQNGRVIAIDVLPMEPIPGVEFRRGDFSDPSVAEALRQDLGDRRADLVMSDMAPNITGNRAIDQPRSIGLAEDALFFAEQVLRPGGDFLVKLFQGSGFDEFVASVRERFGKVKIVKPKASRASSREIYLLARDLSM